MYIRQLRVTNYRSLKEVSIGSLSSLVVFYGENDSGKSNILALLEHVFKQKYEEDVTEVSKGESLIQKRPSGFWRGVIDDFSDNFYNNTAEPITFSIRIRFFRREIKAIRTLPKKFFDALSRNAEYDHLEISGQISSLGFDRATITLLTAKFNQKLFYDGNASIEGSRYLPGFKELNATEKAETFERIMGSLDNAFARVSPDRFLGAEEELDRVVQADLKPHSFKNWLFQISIDRDKEKIFRQISQQFGNPPFAHGRILIARVGNEIEAFVENQDGLKLPIGRKGSGVQQILMILSYVAASNSPIIGIEELEINLSPEKQAAIFNSLHKLVGTKDSPVTQIFLTTHSPHIARRNEAERRGVWMANGETHVKRPREAEVTRFFRFLH
ncbi:MAG TPA: AAA family ATPase [Anaerolineae bacterium]|nr:AAA family ATPase [Anaerolineae bacterium]